MKTEKIEYMHGNVTLEAYAAYEEGKKRPGILIFHAWRGRDEFVSQQAERLAKMGYVGIALDVYGKGVLGESKEENMKLMQPLMEDRKLLQDRMLCGMKAAQAHSAVDKGLMGAIGFCFGGLCALDLARSGADLKGVVSFHGLLEAPENLKNEKIQAKILALHGHDDPMVTPEDVRRFKDEMTKARVDWQLHVYGNTMHAFTNPIANDPGFGTVYSKVAAKRAMQSMENFFKEIF